MNLIVLRCQSANLKKQKQTAIYWPQVYEVIDRCKELVCKSLSSYAVNTKKNPSPQLEDFEHSHSGASFEPPEIEASLIKSLQLWGADFLLRPTFLVLFPVLLVAGLRMTRRIIQHSEAQKHAR